MLKIVVAETPGWNSSYGPRGSLVPVPRRMRWLHPDALAAIVKDGLADRLIFTDVYRSPESSLNARRTKRGVQRPGYSAHNFGLACDLDVERTLKQNKWDKRTLDAAMRQAGFECLVAGAVKKTERWHFSFGAAGPGSVAVERAIVARYGPDLAPDGAECQTLLRRLRLYSGAIDGKIGPISREAIMAFQRTWLLAVDGKLGSMTRRTIAVVAADLVTADGAIPEAA